MWFVQCVPPPFFFRFYEKNGMKQHSYKSEQVNVAGTDPEHSVPVCVVVFPLVFF